MSKVTLTSLLTLLFAAEATAAASLLNYEHRVVRAAEQIERIKADKDYGEEGITDIKRLLPRSEQIEVDGREVSIDNAWLHAVLDSYAAEKDPQQSVARLNEASGRLRALDDHLRRAEAAQTSDAGSAREKIREILSRPAYQPEQETVVGAFVKKVLRKVRGFFGEIYSALTRLLERLFGASAQGGWISNLLLIAVLAAALVALARMARRMRVPRAKRKKTRLVLGEEIASDGTSRELAEAGLAAARAGDFRTAVRKLYVSLLYEMGERNLIELDDSATNREYLSRVSRFTALAGPMRYLTDRFDHVWYGMFPSSEEDFAAYLARYEEAMERARTVGEQAASAS
ncbi:MAG: DUF4129 domain-containing protein [Acidobacteriota bacterium]